MQRSQPEIAELINSERPAWAITLFRDMEDYIACGERSFSSDDATAFEDFAETDRMFDEAFVACADDRFAFTAIANKEMLEDGTFSTAAEAAGNIERIRAMAFSFAMVNKFGSTKRSGAAEKYAEARFSELVEAVRDVRKKHNKRPDAAQYEIPELPKARPPAPPPPPPPPPRAPMPESTQYKPDPYEGWNAVKPDPFVVDNPADVMRWQLEGFPESTEGNQELAMSIDSIHGDMLGVSLLRYGLLDDSINATWTYAELKPTDDGKWKVMMMGEKWRCRRSGSDNFVITPCP